MCPYDQQGCCPRFDPAPWEDAELAWDNRLFVKDRVVSFLHIPLNYGAVMKRNADKINALGAFPDPAVILTDENSLWGADIYVGVTREIPGANMTRISGTFISRVFEGPYRDVKKWIAEMERHVRDKGKTLRKLYFFYTTCPSCAKKYGKNYVVLLAQV